MFSGGTPPFLLLAIRLLAESFRQKCYGSGRPFLPDSAGGVLPGEGSDGAGGSTHYSLNPSLHVTIRTLDRGLSSTRPTSAIARHSPRFGVYARSGPPVYRPAHRDRLRAPAVGRERVRDPRCPDGYRSNKCYIPSIERCVRKRPLSPAGSESTVSMQKDCLRDTKSWRIASAVRAAS